MTSTWLEPFLDQVRLDTQTHLRVLKIPNRFPDPARSEFAVFNGGKRVMTVLCSAGATHYGLMIFVPDTLSYATHIPLEGSSADLASPDILEAVKVACA